MFSTKNSSNKLQSGWVLLACLVIISLALSGCGSGASSRVFHVGVLSGLDAFAPAVDGFKAQMTTLGYIEGKNITYDVVSTNVDTAAYQAAIKKFVAEKVDLIYTFPTEAALEAKTATQGTSIPVVFALAFTDVKGVNLIDSIRTPGGNITGVRFPSADIASKRMEILLQLVPNAKRIFVPYLKDYPNVPGQLDVVRSEAASKGVTLVEFGAASPQDLQTEVDSLVTSDGVGIDAILIIAEPLGITPVFFSILSKFSYTHKIPIGGAYMTVEGKDGSIFGLLPDAKTAGQQSALLADKVFRGTSAGTIPVSTSDSYFQISMVAAQQLGVTVPVGLLQMANQVIR
jgi:putative tryptophan/tyrosine transport system substrate-binding protein